MAERMSEFETALLGQVNAIAVIGRAMLPRDRFDPEDLVQEVILRAWANRDGLRDAASLPTWVSAIARNTARDWIRRPEAVPSDWLPDTPAPVISALDRAHDHERLRALLHALESLDPADRELLVARYRDDVPYSDLQARTGLSYAAVTSRVHRARQRVRRLLVTAGAALGVLFAPRQRAFGQAATRTAGGSAPLALAAAVSVILLGGVGFGLRNADDDAPGARSLAMRIADIPAARRRPALVGELIEDIRRYDEAPDTYSATFRRTSRGFVLREGVGPPQHTETVTEGTLLRGGERMFAEVTVNRWNIDGSWRRPVSQDRKDVTSDGGLMATRRYWASARPSTNINRASESDRYNLLTAWLPGAMPLGSYLARLVESPDTDVAAERVEVDGVQLYRIVTTAGEAAQAEYLVDPARGYRLLRRVYENGDARTQMDVDPRHAGGDVWYPARVTVTSQDVGVEAGGSTPSLHYSLEISEFSTATVIPNDAFAAVPERGNPFYDAIRDLPDRGVVVD
ncbi:MAG: sigma-70 family RNA polymerase sigma factor [Candidatus Poribacteria bacterium]